jgi:hypothetical protein
MTPMYIYASIPPPPPSRIMNEYLQYISMNCNEFKYFFCDNVQHFYDMIIIFFLKYTSAELLNFMTFKIHLNAM